MKVKLDKNNWLLDIHGEVLNTQFEVHAYDYKTHEYALNALTVARTFEPYPDAEIVEDF